MNPAPPSIDGFFDPENGFSRATGLGQDVLMTPTRYDRLRQVLSRRQTDLTVILENVHKPHNLSAILRSCDAVGVPEVTAVIPSYHPAAGPAVASAASAHKWVTVNRLPRIEEAYHGFRERGFGLVAVHPGPAAEDFRTLDFTGPTALVFGAEKDGLSNWAVHHADRTAVIPMMGLVQSLNVSVAAALILFEAQRQREKEGLYGRSRFSPEEYRRILFEWTHPEVASRCQVAGVAYPALDTRGEIVGQFPR